MSDVQGCERAPPAAVRRRRRISGNCVIDLWRRHAAWPRVWIGRSRREPFQHRHVCRWTAFPDDPLWRHFSRIARVGFCPAGRPGDIAASAAPVNRTAGRSTAPCTRICRGRAAYARAPAVCHRLVVPRRSGHQAARADLRRFYKRVAIDTEYGGMARQCGRGSAPTRGWPTRCVLMMGNHGVLVSAITSPRPSMRCITWSAPAAHWCWAYSTGHPLRVLPDPIAEKTALAWEQEGAQGRASTSRSSRLCSRPTITLTSSDPQRAVVSNRTARSAVGVVGIGLGGLLLRAPAISPMIRGLAGTAAASAFPSMPVRHDHRESACRFHAGVVAIAMYS